ncbi:MAG TPA: extracellular solute-binding protein [Rectinemataceae bacterium]|nr:extracellular solute-binding protein [Rectinemataceae bacterium]
MKNGKFSRILALCLALAAFSALALSAQEKVKLTLGSWRADDVAQMTQLLAAFSTKYPNIEIKFDPTNPPDYNAALRLQLQSGIGPDLMYARSYDTGLQLFKDGYFADVTDLPGLKTEYSALARAPWADAAGRSFAVPFCAVSHGVYYNKDIFKKYGLSVPTTWQQFLELCKTLKAHGVTPLANGLADQWDINEVVLMNIAPNFLGGPEGRLAYESGKRKFNDAAMVSLFQAMKDIAPYCPKGFEALTYNDENAIFANQKAAMYFDGSWTMASFNALTFDWSVFAPPPPAGKKGYVTFHPDSGIAMNPATKHPAECKLFLEWLYSDEAAPIVANLVPTGFFPIAKNAAKITDHHANEFLQMTLAHPTDVRFVWPKLMSGNPSGYNLMEDGAIAVMTNKETPRQAADNLQNGLAQWYGPAK